MRPNFLIVGAMKCGTSALARGVVQHPDVYLTDQKEIHFFDAYWDRGVAWYESHFEGHGGAAAVGEATPYLGFSQVPDRIVEVLGAPRLVAILRHPVDRAYSHYWHNRRREREPLGFEEALEAEQQRTAERRPGWEYARYGRLGDYHEHLLSMEEAVGRDRVLVLLTEDLRHDRVAALRRVWSLLGVDPDRGNTAEAAPSTTRRARRTLKARLRGRRTKDDGYPPLDPEVRGRLVTRYEPGIVALAEHLDRDLSAWLA